MFKRHFLVRRRYDALALAASFALVGAVDNLAKFLFALFVFAGFYLVLRGHRSVRRAPKALSIALFAYGAWTVGLSLARGEPVVGNRQIGYGLIAIAFAFFPFGLALVARPLKVAVSGARAGLILISLLSAGEFAIWGSRVGLGENVAIFAFVVAALGVLSRIAVAEPYRYLPNSRLWFYLSFLPVVLSQTRAAWAVYGLALLFDVGSVLWRRGRQSQSRLPLLAAIALAAAVTVPGVQILNSGVQRGLAEYNAYDDAVRTETSIGIRMAMWRGSVALVSEHPLVGVGAMARMDEVADRMPASADVIRHFTHLHNLVLDETLSNGVIGLALMLAVFATFLISTWRGSSGSSERTSAVLLVLLVFNFGFFHGVMLHETTLMTMYACFGVILYDLSRPYRHGVSRVTRATPPSAL